MRYAYTTFLMRNDGYLPGALVLGYAIKTQSTHDCICLVTKDISRRARAALAIIYDKIVEINEIRMDSGVKHGRSDRNILMTRFEALRLVEYDKVILLDADVLPLGGYDELFELPAPAGIIMERKEECYRGVCNNSTPLKWHWHDLYEPICPHGAPIPKGITDRVRHDPTNMGVNSGLWLVKPSLTEHANILTALQNPKIVSMVTCFPWPEMQLATFLWSGFWINIDIRYCSIRGYPHVDALYGIHFAGLKPWQIHNRSATHYAHFPDFVLWRKYFTSMYWRYPPLREYAGLKRLWEFCGGLKECPNSVEI